MADALDRLATFADSARADGFTHAVLLGMGGSSLAPEVLRSVLGTRPGWLHLHVLDSTDPAAIAAVDTPARHTLVIVASKSGTTIEPVSLAAAFRKRLLDAGVEHWANQFVAITDAGTQLAGRAHAEGFRELFVNPSDIGGRYSALSFFGLVPASLMGQDLPALIGWGLAELACVAPGSVARGTSGAVALGVAMAAGARHGRDKVTLLLPPALEPFGLWVEQLVAESTGKRGVGVVPIAGESTTEALRYGSDRLFVRMDLSAGDRPAHSDLVTDLLRAGHPVVEIGVPEASALGAEFVRWEIATTVAAALLEINPFDEPNVAQAKEATGLLLQQFKAHGHLPRLPPDRVTSGGVALRASQAARSASHPDPATILAQLSKGDYFALLAYVGPDPSLARELQAFRMAVRDITGAATTFGYGPRYLHSTGQLHKGGANNGVFVLMSAEPRADLEIPGEGLSFGTLELAQALGDFSSLDATRRRALHVHLPRPDPQLVASIAALLLEHASHTAR
jgi:glucose-6-phosphate isomerase